MTTTTQACECDYDYEDERYVKTSRYCPLHDTCSCCADNLGSVRDGREWLCEECSKLCKDCGELCGGRCTSAVTYHPV